MGSLPGTVLMCVTAVGTHLNVMGTNGKPNWLSNTRFRSDLRCSFGYMPRSSLSCTCRLQAAAARHAAEPVWSAGCPFYQFSSRNRLHGITSPNHPVNVKPIADAFSSLSGLSPKSPSIHHEQRFNFQLQIARLRHTPKMPSSFPSPKLTPLGD